MTDSELQRQTPGLPLVVETRYGDLVREVLAQLELAEVSSADDLSALGLSRCWIGRSGLELRDADALLTEIRRRIAGGFGGWTPELGKDREATAAALGGSRIPMATGIQPFGGSRIPMAAHLGPALALTPGIVTIHPTGGSRIPMSAPRVGVNGFARHPGGPVRIGLVDVQFPPDPPIDNPPVRAGHSTFVTDLIGQVAPDAEVVKRLVLSATDDNTTWDVVTAMVQLALDERVDILLLPLGGFTTDGRTPMLFSRAMESIREHTLVIAAAGNHVTTPGWVDGFTATSPAWPAALPDVVAVGSEDLRAGDTQLPYVDVVTSTSEFVAAFPPGEFTQPDGSPATFTGLAKGTGTSFSAAYVAAVTATRMGADVSAADALSALLYES